MNQIITHTGGTISRTRTGLIHRAGAGYGGLELGSDGEPKLEMNKNFVKKSVGRPRNDTLDMKVDFDFSFPFAEIT